MHIADWTPTILNAVDKSLGLQHFDKTEYDGKDMGPLLRGESSFSEQRMIVVQHDIFMNNSAVIKGDYKLILGSPGQPWVFEEPTDSFHHHISGPCENVLFSFQLIELASDLWEEQFGSLPILFTILGYVVAMQRAVLTDYFCESSYRNFLHADFRQIKPLSSDCIIPTLEWDQSEGPRVFLYNLTSDPTESNNLAYSQKELTTQLYTEFTQMLKSCPRQYAG